MSSIKDKISAGEWYSNSHYVRTSNETTYSIGHAYVDNPSKVAEGEANAKLWAASKEMLDILERLNKWRGYDFAEVTPPESIQDIAHDAQKLLDQLNQ